MSEIEHRISLPHKTILVVDDDREVLSLVSNYLCSLGFIVLKAASGEEAIIVAEADSGSIALLLVDAEMPGMSGLEFAESFLSRRSDVPLILMSGFGKHGLGSLSGRIEFLPKPFSFAELAGKTIRLISAKGTQSS
ncbi:MAG: response regulator [Terriglobales bacterium]|jgi:DNA-binding response OmpR family regulator